MTTRSDVESLRAAQSQIVAAAQAELSRFWALMDLTSPDDARDALLEFVPSLVERYGDAAASVAAEWYETVRARAVPGLFNAGTAPPAPVAASEANVRFAAGHLYDGTEHVAMALIGTSIQKQIVGSGRRTIEKNIRSDRSKPRWARIPSGAKTCTWCTIMASRGFVYLTRETAGQGDEYHGDCDCQVVAEWSDHPSIEGYDHERMYDQYSSARSVVESRGEPLNDRTIAAEMRRMFPDDFTDGVISAI